MGTFVLTLGWSFGCCLLLTPAARALGRRWGLVDQPDGQRKVHEKPTPVAGGLALLASVGLALGAVLLIPYPGRDYLAGQVSGWIGILVGAAIICLVGLVDDSWGLRGRYKLLGQLAAVAVALSSGLVVREILLFRWRMELGPLAIPFTIFFLLGAINALNLLDGMDGMLSILGSIISLAMAALAILGGQAVEACLAAALAGALLGFLRYNFPPASIFLGDSGSMLTGFLVGVLALRTSWKGPATLALGAPLALLALPILDSSMAILRRKLTGRRISTADCGHLHHCLQRRGLSPRQVLLWVSLSGLTTVLGGITSRAFQNDLWGAGSTLAVFLGLVATRSFGRAELVLAAQRGLVFLRPVWQPRKEGQARQLQVHLQGSVNWKELWEQLTWNAFELNLNSLCLDVNAPVMQESYHARWNRFGTQGDEAADWHLEIPLLFGKAGVGRVQLSGPLVQEANWGKLARIARTVEDFLSASVPANPEAHLLPSILLPLRKEPPSMDGSRTSLLPVRAVSGRRVALGHAEHRGPRLRVCHLGKFYAPAYGGMETHVRTLARAQGEAGAEVSVLCVNHRNPRGEDITWRPFAFTNTVREWDGPVRVIRMGRQGNLARLDISLGLPGLLRGLSRESFDVLHLHLPNPCMLLSLALCQTRFPLVITYHSDVIRQRILGKCLRPFEHLLLNRAVRILATSPHYPAGSDLLRRYADKVAVLPIGIDLQPFLNPTAQALAHARRLREEHGQPLWLCIGRLVYYKGLQNALHALAAVPGKLIIIGQGPLEGKLRRLAGRLGVAERVVWCGHVREAEMIGAYHAATALWFPSNARSEAFGFVQVEALASGCPVINTAIPDSGVPWVSPHGQTGLTIPVNDPSALAAAAQRVLHEPGLRDHLSRRARERALREFDHRLMAERSLEIYREVLGEALRNPDHSLVA